MAKLIPELDEALGTNPNDLLILHGTSENKDFKIRFDNLVPTSLSAFVLQSGESIVARDSGGTEYDMITNGTGDNIFIGGGVSTLIDLVVFTRPIESLDITALGPVTLGAQGDPLLGHNGTSIVPLIRVNSSEGTVVGSNSDEITLDNGVVNIGNSSVASARVAFNTTQAQPSGEFVFNGANNFINFVGDALNIGETGNSYISMFNDGGSRTLDALQPVRLYDDMAVINGNKLTLRRADLTDGDLAKRTDATNIQIGNSTDAMNLVGSQVLVNGSPLTGGGGGGTDFINREAFDGVASADIATYNIEMKNGNSFLGQTTTLDTANLIKMETNNNVDIGDSAYGSTWFGNSMNIRAEQELVINTDAAGFDRVILDTGQVLLNSDTSIDIVGAGEVVSASGATLTYGTGASAVVVTADTDIVLGTTGNIQLDGGVVQLKGETVLDEDIALRGTKQDGITKVDVAKINVSDELEIGNADTKTVITGNDVLIESTGVLDRVEFTQDLYIADDKSITGSNGVLIKNDVTNNRVQISEGSSSPVSIQGNILDIDSAGVMRLKATAGGSYAMLIADQLNVDDFVWSGDIGGNMSMVYQADATWTQVHAGTGNLDFIATNGTLNLTSNTGDAFLNASGTLNLNGSTVLVNGSPITGSGETNTASNVGTGAGKSFKQKTGVDLEFKSISAGAGITVTNGADDVTIANDGVVTVVGGTNITVDASDPQNPIINGSGGGTFTALTDTPADYAGQAGKAAIVNLAEDALEFGDVTADFLGLTDTPSSYAGQADKMAVVNGSEDGLVFINQPTSSQGLGKRTFSTSGGTPNSGQIKADTGALATATILNMHQSTEDGIDGSIIIESIRAGDEIYIQETSNGSNAVLYTVLDTPVNLGFYYEVSVVVDASQGTTIGNNTSTISSLFTKSGSSGNSTLELEVVLDAISLATAQNPTGLDTPLQIEFGAAQNGGGDPIQIDAAGNITCNETGFYELEFDLQYGRTTSAGAAQLYARALVDGTPTPTTGHAKLDDGEFTFPSSTISKLSLTAGQVVTLEIIRDSSGVDNGGLVQGDPITAGWANAPTAQVTVRRFVGQVVSPATSSSDLTRTWNYVKSGIINTVTVLGTDSAFTTPSGYYIAAAGGFDVIGIELIAGSGSCIQATDVDVRIATDTKDNGTQFSFGAGTTVTTQTMLPSTQAESALFGRADSVLFPAITVTNDEIMYVEVDPKFWSLTDLRIKILIKEVI